jgi:cytochrome c oxidase subunit 3
MQNKPMGQQVFYALYYTMTGIHALHVIIGIGAIAVAAKFVKSGRCHGKRPDLLENVGLYWHLVDVIWIFLFPLFYLIG